MATGETEQVDVSQSRSIAPRPPGAQLEIATRSEMLAPGSNHKRAAAISERPAKRGRIACQRCRQSKLRCEGSEGGIQPCQRCAKLSWPCIIDAEYKRVSKRTTLNDLANHVELLKAAGTLSGQESTSAGTNARLTHQTVSPPSQISPLNVPAESLDNVPGNVPQDPGSWLDSFHDGFPITEGGIERTLASNVPRREASTSGRQASLAASTARTIDTITINPTQIQHYFEVYSSFYHPTFPILLLPISGDVLYETSPLLFWVVITTAARHDSLDFSLLQALVPAVKRLLWSTIPSVPHTLPPLQAMAILCVWTFPVASMPLDITLILAGILKSAATHAGLHRPDILTHYSRSQYSLGPAKLRAAIKVWCCTYVAIEGVAAGNGQQPYFSTDRIIEQASVAANPHDLPEVLHQAVLTQIFCNKVHSAMSAIDILEGSASQLTRSSLLKVLEFDLRELEKRLGSPRSHRASVYFLSACFQLRAYWLFDDEESSARREGVIKAFDTATQLLYELRHGETNGSPMKYLTFFTLRVAFTAAVVISKIIHSSYGQCVEIDQGKQAFNTCISIFRQSCVEDNDMNGRTTKVLAQLWTIHLDLFVKSPQQPPRLSLKSRLFFSIAYDALWQWREKYAGEPSNGAPSLPPPFMPSSSARTPDDTASVEDEPLPSSALPTPQSEPIMNIEQAEDSFDNHNTLSTVAGQQFLSSSDFTDADTLRQPIISVPEQDNLTRNTGFLNPNALNFDLLFPDSIMSCYSDEVWLNSMR